MEEQKLKETQPAEEPEGLGPKASPVAPVESVEPVRAYKMNKPSKGTYKAKYYQNNKVKCLARVREWQSKNKELVSERCRVYNRTRYQNDPEYREKKKIAMREYNRKRRLERLRMI